MKTRKPSETFIDRQFDYLESLAARGIRTDLSVMRRALAILDHPEKKAPVVIVGGTNGKGSTTAMIGNIIRHAEYSVGCYYSPHIHDVRERIQLDGTLISAADLAGLIRHVRDRLQGHVDPTYFEFLTLSAYYWFAEKGADLAVMEVGMGGRFDATNVTDPLVSVITTVSLDHTAYLGDSREAIAVEKAQIVPPDGSLVVGRVSDGVARVLADEVKAKAAELFRLDVDFQGIRIETADMSANTRMRYRGLSTQFDDILLPLSGAHQIDNAAVALAAVEILGRKGFSVGERSVRQGIASIRLPGRIQLIAVSPEVIVDVAHNPAGARVLADYLRTLPKKKTALVIGMMADKDIEGFLREITGEADIVVLAPPGVERAASLDALVRAATLSGSSIRPEETVAQAVDYAVQAVGDTGRVVVTGSFYTVHEAIDRVGEGRRPT